MRMLSPNLDREDGLETVLEVPIPDEVFGSNNNKIRPWQNMKSWVKPNQDRSPSSFFGGSRNAEIQLLLGVVGAPLIPLPIDDHTRPINSRNIAGNLPIESSIAKYIVQQYIAAAGGDKALDSIESMYAVGKVKMSASEFIDGDGSNRRMKTVTNNTGGGEMGGFVLWQKRPDLWSLELLVSGCKITAGSDGKVAWRQTPWHNSHASRGPPRPLRRCLQGLDPRSTANLFWNSVCIGEKTINGEDCFVLKMETESSTLKARSSNNVEIIRHTIWGYFSQRTGLLVNLEDSHLLRIKTLAAAESDDDNSIFWETTMESSILDYRVIDGVNVAHGGRTTVSLFRYGDGNGAHTRTKMEESWMIEEVGFNVMGLSLEFFLPPGDLKRDKEDEGGMMAAAIGNNKITGAGAGGDLGKTTSPWKGRGGGSRVANVDLHYLGTVDENRRL
ncbi:uncharacterized protein LOC124931502 [Impatiens glandulifera]|uniref:uncharacterized protein LOC124931502 n=1 Tax=Impatiens glandulifera TaxID=253017 RepID=UPI001FB09318|nr:uncharacterized protein LOC124931502 [Impatiens glandulifera]